MAGGAQVTEQSLTLYDIQVELLRDVELRQELIAGEYELMPEERTEAIAECEMRIAAYIDATPGKVDNTTGFLKECTRREEIDKAEADRIYERAKAWKAKREYVEECVIRALQAVGKERIEGRHSTLALRKCPSSVEVAQPELVPIEYNRVVVKLPMPLWEACRRWAMRDEELSKKMMHVGIPEVEARRGEIAKVLKSTEPCSKCGNDAGLNPGRIWTTPDHDETGPCDRCGGSGQAPKGVAGCRLITDKVRLEVR